MEKTKVEIEYLRLKIKNLKHEVEGVHAETVSE